MSLCKDAAVKSFSCSIYARTESVYQACLWFHHIYRVSTFCPVHRWDPFPLSFLDGKINSGLPFFCLFLLLASLNHVSLLRGNFGKKTFFQMSSCVLSILLNFVELGVRLEGKFCWQKNTSQNHNEGFPAAEGLCLPSLSSPWGRMFHRCLESFLTSLPISHRFWRIAHICFVDGTF